MGCGCKCGLYTIGPHFSSLEETSVSLIQTDHETSVEGEKGGREEGERDGKRKSMEREKEEGGRKEKNG